MIVKNPVLRGFNPDPSILKVGDTFYIATSTFEVYPGIQIHESKDMVNFEVVSQPLTEDIIDLTNNNPSSGVWAPDITYKDGEFYIVFSNVKTWSRGPFKDVYNYIIHSKSIKGPWSKPVFINSSGFDASLFHDDDGKSYFINQEWDYRGLRGAPCFRGILVQEIDLVNMTLIGEAKNVFRGTDRGLVEGPHIFKRNGYYYLICAEGGTDFNHAESVSRSTNVFGQYITHPNKLILSSKDSDAFLQRAGHASFVDGGNLGWFMAHLCSRPIDKKCMLGRETAIQNIYWENDWPYLKGNTILPYDTYEVKGEVECHLKKEIHYDIESERFKLDFQTLRRPMDEFIKKENGKLILTGKQSVDSYYEQMTLQRRIQEFDTTFGCRLTYDPSSFDHMAGIMIRYQEGDLYFIYVTVNEKNERVLRILTQNDFKTEFYNDIEIRVPQSVFLKIHTAYRECRFYYSLDGSDYKMIGPVLDATLLSDQVVKHGGFTGAFYALHVSDLKEAKKEAIFEKIYYKEND